MVIVGGFNTSGDCLQLFNPLLPGLTYRFRFLNQPGIFVLFFHQRRNILFLGIRFDVAGFQLLFSVGANGCVRLDLGVGVFSFVLNGRNLGVNFCNPGAHLFRQQSLYNLNLFAASLGGFTPTGKLHGVKILVAENLLQH